MKSILFILHLSELYGCGILPEISTCIMDISQGKATGFGIKVSGRTVICMYMMKVLALLKSCLETPHMLYFVPFTGMVSYYDILRMLHFQ